MGMGDALGGPSGRERSLTATGVIRRWAPLRPARRGAVADSHRADDRRRLRADAGHERWIELAPHLTPRNPKPRHDGIWTTPSGCCEPVAS
jgi:hypothetical protein